MDGRRGKGGVWMDVEGKVGVDRRRGKGGVWIDVEGRVGCG